MGNNKGFKNRLEKFFSGEEGQRILNFAYSFGAAIVILGALFKLLHLPMADIMLCVGMGTEALIFALSAFDKPATNYHWEDVFPVLKSGDEADRPNLNSVVQGMQQAPATSVSAAPGAPVNAAPGHHAPADHSYAAAAPTFGGHAPINTTEVHSATERYVNQMQEMTSQMERLNQITTSLAQVQSTLLNSYTAITDNSDQLNLCSSSYMQQMEALNRNITGLNTIYEIQLKSVSSQLDTIDKVNSGLSNIRNMYDNSTMDSFKIRQETEKMTDNLAQLNKVYERMLSAMTVNMQNSGLGR